MPETPGIKGSARDLLDRLRGPGNAVPKFKPKICFLDPLSLKLSQALLGLRINMDSENSQKVSANTMQRKSEE